MTFRMGGQDGAFARNETVTGIVAGQWVWVYDRPVDLDGLRRLHAALCRGRLGRVAAPALLGAAGDRWTGRAVFAPLQVDTAPVRRDRLEDWAAARGNDELTTYGGPAWRLATTPLDDGGSAVSLVLSHAIGDGYTQVKAVMDAVAGTDPGWTYPADDYGAARMLLSDGVAALRNYGRAARAVAGIIAGYRMVAHRKTPPLVEVPGAPPGGGPEVSRVHVAVPSGQWRRAATSRGGTATTLVVAVMSELADGLGRVRPDGNVQLMLPAAIRTPELDRHANSLGWAMFDVDARAGFATGLGGLRTRMKQVYAADSVENRIAELLWRVHPAIPRPLLRWGLRRSPTDLHPMTTECSVVGELDPAVTRADGTPAASTWLALRRQGETPAQLRRQGGVLRATMIDVNGEVSLSISGSHPAGAEQQFRAQVAKVLGNYGLTPDLR